MLSWLKRFREPKQTLVSSGTDDAMVALKEASAEFDKALLAYRVATVEIYARRADEDQRQRIRDSRIR